MTGHSFEKMNREERKNTDSGKHAKRLSLETMDNGMAMVSICRNEHTHVVF